MRAIDENPVGQGKVRTTDLDHACVGDETLRCAVGNREVKFQAVDVFRHRTGHLVGARTGTRAHDGRRLGGRRGPAQADDRCRGECCC